MKDARGTCRAGGSADSTLRHCGAGLFHKQFGVRPNYCGPDPEFYCGILRRSGGEGLVVLLALRRRGEDRRRRGDRLVEEAPLLAGGS